MGMDNSYSIREVVEIFGVSKEMIRFYEKQGLIHHWKMPDGLVWESASGE